MFYFPHPGEELPPHCVLSDHAVYQLLPRKQDSLQNNSDLSQFPGDFIKERKIRKSRINRGQAAKIMRLRRNVYYSVEVDKYLLTRDERYCLTNHETINPTGESRHDKIKCVWQSNDPPPKRPLLNKDGYDSDPEIFPKPQSNSASKTPASAATTSGRETASGVEINSYTSTKDTTASTSTPTAMANMLNDFTLPSIRSILGPLTTISEERRQPAIIPPITQEEMREAAYANITTFRMRCQRPGRNCSSRRQFTIWFTVTEKRVRRFCKRSERR